MIVQPLAGFAAEQEAPVSVRAVMDVHDPPSLNGSKERSAAHVTLIDVKPFAAASNLLEPFAGVAVAGLDGGLSPVEFLATTVIVYVVPFTRPLIEHCGVADDVQDAPPGVAVAVYSVTGAPPLLAGLTAVHATRAER